MISISDNLENDTASVASVPMGKRPKKVRQGKIDIVAWRQYHGTTTIRPSLLQS